MRRTLLACVALASVAGPANASFSGRDGRIAYSDFPDAAGKPSSIYTMTAAAADRRRLTTKGSSRNPAWSSNGKLIAFDRAPDAGGLRRLYVMRADGSGQRRVPMGRVQSHNPAWSPDGRRLVFQGCGRRARCERDSIFVVRRDGRGLSRIAADGVDPVWSPDGRWIAYAGRLGGDDCQTLVLVRPSGRGRHAILPRDSGPNCTGVAGMDFSPDSRRLVYFGLRPTDAQFTYDSAMYTVGIDGSGRKLVVSRPVADGGFFLRPFVWSPSGGDLLWRDDRGTHLGDPRGGARRRIAGPSAGGGEYAWQPRPRDRS